MVLIKILVTTTKYSTYTVAKKQPLCHTNVVTDAVHNDYNERRHTAYTERQESIIKLLLDGCENKDIARQLKVSMRTVKFCLSRLFVQHGLSNHRRLKRVQLAVLLWRERNGTNVNVKKRH